MTGKIRDMRPPFEGLNGQTPDELFGKLKTPCYILDEAALIRNLKILAAVQKDTGCRILLAQKAFSNFNLYPLMSQYLCGTEASGLYEAKLGKEEMPEGEVHVFCGAYREDEFEELLTVADHIVFNSPTQLKKYAERAKRAGKSIGIRINPEMSTQEGHEIYDPCAPGSRMGTTREQWNKNMTSDMIQILDGIHFHTLCEQNSDDLSTTLCAVEEKFGDILALDNIKWLNMGGGHHITRHDYDVESLEKCIRYAQEKWNVTVYLEPGEACALNAGYLATRVLDVGKNGNVNLAILDASAACHMPDVIEMPYVPPLYGAENAAECDSIDTDENTVKIGQDKRIIYRLGGPTCLSGDVIGDYRFDGELKEGDLLLFGDMAIYTTCKNNTFNGMPLPAIMLLKASHSAHTTQTESAEHYDTDSNTTGREILTLAEFGYADFKSRLGK
jgi:carboxynorspermidine decarboxylase